MADSAEGRGQTDDARDAIRPAWAAAGLPGVLVMRGLFQMTVQTACEIAGLWAFLGKFFRLHTLVLGGLFAARCVLRIPIMRVGSVNTGLGVFDASAPPDAGCTASLYLRHTWKDFLWIHCNFLFVSMLIARAG
jgi:hypothetical protein